MKKLKALRRTIALRRSLTDEGGNRSDDGKEEEKEIDLYDHVFFSPSARSMMGFPSFVQGMTPLSKAERSSA